MKTLMSTLFFLLIASIAEAALSPNEIVQKADLKRGLGEISHSFDVKITNSNGKSEEYHVSFKNVDSTLSEQTAPEKARGRKVLMLGYDMWLFTKNIKKPVRISLDQKLSGEVANGDIARTNYAVDYEATLLNEDQGEYLLDLKAKNNKVTYGKIQYRISKKDFKPIEATYYAVSGKALKKAVFENFKMIDGIERSTRMIISDFLLKDRTSTMDFSNHKKETFKDSLFNKDRLDF